MKAVTFAAAFVLTAILVIAGIILYPDILGQAATINNEIVFAFFLGPFCVFLFFGWVSEKIIFKLRKKQ